jgi:hypothetical protein
METIVVVGVMALIMLIISQIFVLNYEMFFRQSLRTDNETGAILAARSISQLSRGAIAVEASHDFSGTVHTSSDSTLVLKMPAVDGSDNIIAGVYDYAAFYRDPTDATKIFIVTDPGSGSVRQLSARRLTSYNDTLIFRYNAATITAADRISVLLINQQTRRGATVTNRAWTSIFLRNN